MARTGFEVAEACVAKAKVELEGLAREGLIMSGNAFASYLIVKGEPDEAEASGKRPLLYGADGKALRASLEALGYAPQDWVALCTKNDAGDPIDASILRLAVMTLDPATVVAEDDVAAQALREAFCDELAQEEQFEVAMLEPGYVAQVLGMRMMALGGFQHALGDDHKKQVMWSYLKLLAPLGEPY